MNDTKQVIQRHPANPILTAADVPYPACLVFNAGATRFRGQYVMVFRNDDGDAERQELNGETHLGIALSADGVDWRVEDRLLFPDPAHPLYRAYDPRLTVVEDRLYMCFALGDAYGTCGGIAVTDDMHNWEVLSVSVPDNRNMVLFPERVGGKFVRLERPFAGYLRPGDRFDLWLSMSPDGRYWGDSKLVLGTDQVSWVNNKIGPGAPPIRTDRGWLALTHGVDIADGRTWGWSGDWNKRYCAGLILLDLEEPWRVIGMAPGPVLAPAAEVPYEMAGYRDQVIFPGGMIAEPDGSIKIYYGAADTVEALATAQLTDLLDLCEPV
jgi:beta-1,4-mannooligosaccharide/beta-1,4-mannosyl-N-acetylglucosamine phosphorylase